MRVLTGWEVGEIGENYTTVPNILQSKRDLRDEAKKKRAGNAKHRRQEDWTSPFPLLAFRKSQFIRLFSSADKYDNSVIQ